MSDASRKKAFIVTGGATGIGYACAQRLLEEGASVTICGRSEAALAAASESLSLVKGGGGVSAISCNVADPEAVDQLFSEAEARQPIDGVVHAAAVLGPIGSILQVEPKDWMTNIENNLLGTYVVVRRACLAMKQRGGRIVAFSGGGASGPFPNYTAYACSKVALVRFVETVAQEMKPYGIEINAIAPGFVVTKMHEETISAGSDASGSDYLERTRAEIAKGGVPPSVPAECASFFLSDLANGVTGRFIAAVYDNWRELPRRLEELNASDVFTLRRIVGKDRGLNI